MESDHNPAGHWVSNLKRLCATLKTWASEKHIANMILKGKLSNDISILDKKDEIGNLTLDELITRKILRKSLDKIFEKEKLNWKQRS